MWCFYSWIAAPLAVAHGDNLHSHGIKPALVEPELLGHLGAYIDETTLDVRSAVCYAHNAALAGAVAGDAHRAGQGQGTVRGISQVGVQVLPNGAYIAVGLIMGGNAGGLVMQGAFHTHGHKAGAFHCVGGFLVALIFREIRVQHLLAACQHQRRHNSQP